MAAPDPDISVHSFHINIGTGDSAIHLLVNLSTAPKPTILRACLIDGGECQEAVTAIKATIKKIKEDYIVPTSHNDAEVDIMRFDSVVITHWDTDHYKGIVLLIKDDFERQLQRILETTNDQAVVERTLKAAKCRYFRYGATKADRETTMYAPYWLGDGENNRKGVVAGPDDKASEFAKDTPLTFIWNRGKRPKDIAILNLRLPDLCDVFTDAEGMMGMNFLNNQRADATMDYKTVGNPAALQPFVSKTDGRPVGIYCIACCSVVMGRPNRISSFMQARPQISPLVGESPIEVFVVDEDQNDKNEASIGAVVMWHGPASRHVSHYFAGDAGYQLENAMATWIGQQIPSLKLNHHGAVTSTPMGAIEFLQPTNIVVSAGKNNKYKHPSWQTLLYLNAWLIQSNHARALFATRFPYYLEEGFEALFDDEWCKKYINVASRVPRAYSDFWATLDAIYEELPAKPLRLQAEDWKHDVIDAGQAEDVLENYVRWVLHQVRTAWRSNLSDMFAVESTEKVIYILIESNINTTTGAVSDNVRVQYTNTSQDYGRHGVVPAVRTARADNPTDLGEPLYPDIIVEDLLQSYASVQNRDLTLSSRTPYLIRATAGDVDNQGYWLGVEKGVGISEIEDPRLKRFAKNLHSDKFGLTLRPIANSQPLFLEGDEWNCWFADVLSATELHMFSGATSQPAGFWVETQLPFGDSIKLKFSTKQLRKIFDVPQGFPTDMGLISNTSVMAYGLEDGMTATAKVSDLIKYIGLEPLEKSPLITAIGDQISVSLHAGEKVRNAIWFQPDQGYRLVERLQWKFDATALNQFFTFCNAPLDIESAYFITTRGGSWRPDKKNKDDKTVTPNIAREAHLRIEMAIKGGEALYLLGSIKIQPRRCMVVLTAITSSWDAFFKWLRDSFNLDIGEAKGILDDAKDFVSAIVPRRLCLEIETVGSTPTLKNWSVAVEITIKSVSFLLTYSSSGKMLRGELWLPKPARGAESLLPGWEPSDELQPLKPGTRSELDLADLNPGGGVVDVPKFLPTKLKELAIEINKESISFYSTLECRPPSGSYGIPAVQLQSVALFACYYFKKPSDFTVELSFFVNLRKPQKVTALEDTDGGDLETTTVATDGRLDGAIRYRGGKWTLEGSIRTLSFRTVYQLLDPDAAEDVASVLGNMELSTLDLEYNYEKGIGSDFTLSGTIKLGELDLSMSYAYTQDGWEFTADLATSNKSATLGSVVKSIIGNRDEGTLPDFATNIPLAGDKDNKLISLYCARMAKSTDSARAAGSKVKREDSFILFKAELSIRLIKDTYVKVTFVQYRDLALDAKHPPKRIFKIALASLPTVSVPTVGELPQPFDEMAYMWVQDNSTTGKRGLTQQDVEYLNRTALTAGSDTQGSGEWLLFRDERNPEQRKPGDVVVAAGSHFIIIQKTANQRKAILDYTFQSEKKKKSKSLEIESFPRAAAPKAASGGDGNSAMASLKKTAGAISISNIGLKYKDNILSVLVDASFLLGPVSFTFIGAEIKINLKNRTLQQFTEDVKFDLAGLVVAFDRPPVRLGGKFMHGNDEQLDYYAGGIVVGLEPYQFTAAGMYGIVKKPTNFKTAFVFAKLEGPLITLAFAEISGITGGFGYNSEVKPPTIEAVPSFPFASGAKISDNLLETLGNLVSVDGSGAFTIRNESMWIAAGLKVSAFKMLSLDAVVVVSWNPSVTIGVYGVAVVDIPKARARPFAHVELGILAVVDFDAGIFKVEAQLAPSSFVFDPSCRLTGGFALYYWFGDRALERKGDWVFTIGGYHRSFVRPDYYPNPPRLGISWQVGSNISITGEAYFAITPKCCMGGGRLSATLRAGPLSAWFTAWADFLIKYQPFYFMAEGGVSVGVSCKVDLLFTSFTVSAEIGATLYLAGPPLHGRIHVDFWVTSFNVNFGPDAKRADPPSLEEFYELVLQTEEKVSFATMLMAPAIQRAPTKSNSKGHVFSCYGGLLEGKGDKTTTKQKETWQVKSDKFVFAVHARFALSKATIMPPEESGAPHPDVKPQVFEDGPVYARPMEIKTAIQSELTIAIKPVVSYYSLTFDDSLSEQNWQVQKIVKESPSALWGSYNEAEDPRLSGNNVKSLLNGEKGTIPMFMGLEIRPPKSKLADDLIGTFNAIEAMKQAVFTAAEKTPKFPAFKDQKVAWAAPAKSDPKDKARYKKVQSTWKNNGVDKRQAVVEALGRGLGWNRKLTAVTPKRLVEGLGNLYMLSPEISVG